MAEAPTSGSVIPNAAAAVTPSDTGALQLTCVALYVGVAGNVAADLAGAGSDVDFIGVPAGTVLPGRFSRVYSTNTTATNIVQLYVV